MYQKQIIGIDAGSDKSGIIVLVKNRIRHGYNIPNNEVIDFVRSLKNDCKEQIVIVEDVRPYNMRITDGIIKTIKFLGELEWRLSQLGQKYELIPRWSVKQWVFLQFKLLAVPEIEKKIIRSKNLKEKKIKQLLAAGKEKEAGDIKITNPSPGFVYVDDRIVANAMRQWWNIKNPSRVGERAAYGLKDHSWQALGLVSFYMASNGLKINKE